MESGEHGIHSLCAHIGRSPMQTCMGLGRAAMPDSRQRNSDLRCGVDSSGAGYGPVAGFCEHGDEFSGRPLLLQLAS
jgi:hypothetical protein